MIRLRADRVAPFVTPAPAPPAPSAPTNITRAGGTSRVHVSTAMPGASPGTESHEMLKPLSVFQPFSVRCYELTSIAPLRQVPQTLSRISSWCVEVSSSGGSATRS